MALANAAQLDLSGTPAGLDQSPRWLMVGIDEAGYGPNLGPLVVAATRFWVPAALCSADWWHCLEPIISQRPSDSGFVGRRRRSATDLPAVVVADSKQILAHPVGEAILANTLATFWNLLPPNSTTPATTSLYKIPSVLDAKSDFSGVIASEITDFYFSSFLRTFAAQDWEQYLEQPEAILESSHSCQVVPIDLPAKSSPTEASPQATKILAQKFSQVGIDWLGWRARLLWPARFNEELTHTANKADLHLQLVRQLLRDSLPTLNAKKEQRSRPRTAPLFAPLFGESADLDLAPAASLPTISVETETAEPSVSGIWLVCDRLGGRRRYLPLLQELAPQLDWQVEQESATQSTYCADTTFGTMMATFRIRAEAAALPVALASMTAKWLREAAMVRFNRFWQTHCPGLLATKGYPEDAKRFWDAISTCREQLQIHPTRLWRQR